MSCISTRQLSVCGGGPSITENIGNMTVALGREATLKCVVTQLSDYKVAWVHIDRQMILTIGRHVITRIPRFNIIHDSHHTWTLHIKDVQAEDKGYYMCQVNTDPMISQTGHLDVVVPPTIIDEESSPSTVSIREKHNASLICRAGGEPQPNITWRREDGKSIYRDVGRAPAGLLDKEIFQGEYLDLQVPLVISAGSGVKFIIFRTFPESRWAHICALPATRFRPP